MEWHVTVSPFFLLSHLHTLIAIQEELIGKVTFVRYSLWKCTLLSRIMKLESRPICGPCGAIFFNYSCRSSTSSGGRRQQVRRVVANKKALFEEEHRSENVIVSRGRTINMNGSTKETLAAKRIKSRVRDVRGAERRQRDRRRARLPTTLLSCRRKKDLWCLFNLVIWKPLSTIKDLVLPTEVLWLRFILFRNVIFRLWNE